MRKYKKKHRKSVIFIDFKSAYNTIFRSILYQILKDKEILTNDEVDFLKHLQNMVFFEVKGRKF